MIGTAVIVIAAYGLLVVFVCSVMAIASPRGVEREDEDREQARYLREQARRHELERRSRS